MTIKSIPIPIDNDLKSYLKEAESAIDALSDDDLERAEAELELRINALAQSPVTLFSHLSSSSSSSRSQNVTSLADARAKASKNAANGRTKNQRSRWTQASLGGFLMAAMALFIIHHSDLSDENHWQTKGGMNESAMVCEASPVPGDSRVVLVTSNCSNGGILVLERFEKGQWQALEKVQVVNRVVTNENGPLDFRRFSGEMLRLRAEHGVSEEFSIEDKKTP